MTYPPRLTPGTRVRDTQSDETGTVTTPGPFCGPEFTPVEFDRDEGHTFVSTWNVPTVALEVLAEASNEATRERLNEEAAARAINKAAREAQFGIDETSAEANGISGFQEIVEISDAEDEALQMHKRWTETSK